MAANMLPDCLSSITVSVIGWTFLLLCVTTSQCAQTILPCQGNESNFVGTVVLTSGNEFLLQDCRLPVTFLLATGTINNVAIAVRGGVVLPFMFWGNAFTASNISVLVENVEVPITSPLTNVFMCLLDTALTNVSVIVRNSVFYFSMNPTSYRGLFLSLSQKSSPPNPPMESLMLVIQNTTVHATAMTSCLIVNIDANSVFASDISVLVLNSVVNITLVRDNFFAADESILFFSVIQAANVMFRVSGSVVALGASHKLCYGAITQRGAYPGSASVVIFRTVFQHVNSSYI
ncbi:Hypothetical protein, putative, partial [Bodo saltans]